MSTRVVRSLGDLLSHGYDLDIECGNCGHQATLDALAVYRVFSDRGWTKNLSGGFLDSPYNHFKCTRCGGRPKQLGPIGR